MRHPVSNIHSEVNKSISSIQMVFSDKKINFTEVLQDPAVLARLSDTKAASEVKALEQFYQILQTEPAKAFYGKNHVIRAADAQAVETLLISDNLFR